MSTPETLSDPAEIAPLPEVSVLLAVHNGERYLESALRSVMDQSLRNIEIVVVDDCSTDSSPAILRRLAEEDPRLRILTAPQNLRLPGALNFGLEHVRAPLVARMDDDDICLPNRLDVQKRYMDAHPEIALLGSSIQWIDETGKLLRVSMRSRDTFAIRWMARFYLNLSHPSFMFRPTLPDGTALRYDTGLYLAEDHDLVCRMLLAGAQIACQPEVLLQYRAHAKSVSHAKRAQQMAMVREIVTRFQEQELPPDLVAALASLRDCYFGEPPTPARIAGCFSGARAMLVYDIAHHPERAAWLRRQTAQFIAWALQRAGASRGQIARAFLRYGPDMLPAMALRALETKGYLPARLHSDPEIAHPA